ncbi:MAG: carboxy terminal-processing peptidase [Chromatiales bacterium]|nr:carboxy terminal-processing peptidase [Chromatiales bacterium]
MQKFLSLLLLLLIVPLGENVQARVEGSPEDLEPTRDQRLATELITQIMGRYHYRKVPLDDQLSARLLDRYLKDLDPNRSYFLASDTEAFSAYKTRMDDYLLAARLSPAFQIFKTFARRLEERMEYALGLLEHDFDFDIDEDYLVDRSEAPWPSSREEMNEIWRKRVKNDFLTLKLAGKKPDEIKETLGKRYKQLLKRTRQFGDDDVYQLFINAYTQSVEPHTNYFSPMSSENFEIRMTLSLEGIGAELTTENEYTRVRRVITGGPADLSKLLHSGDRIVGVAQGDEESVTDVIGWRLDDVVDLIRGPKGTVVRLEILPKGTGQEGPSKVIRLVRNKIKLEEQAAKSSVLEVPGKDGAIKIGVIDLPTFYMDYAARARGEADYKSTTRDVRRLLKELQDQGVAGVVMDLRGNSGGSLTEATDLTGLFIKSGPVVQVRDANGDIEVNTDPDPEIAYSGPLAVLVDRSSASASEIFAGAIQDYHRGIVIGEPTYGKGTVQQLVNLDRYVRNKDSRLGQLKMTIAQFFRVNGESTQNRGVIPDIEFHTRVTNDKYGESAQANALPWAEVNAADFTPVNAVDRALGDARRGHLLRAKTDVAFQVLLEEAAAADKADEKKTVSLLETRRRQERDNNEKAQRARTNRLRISKGLEPLPLLTEEQRAAELAAKEAEEENADAEDEKKKDEDDVLLTESARILGDVIQFNVQPGRSALTAGGV